MATIAAAFSPALRAPLLFDDVQSIEGNPTIQRLRPLAATLNPPPALAVSGRPVVNLSLAVSYAVNRAFSTQGPGGIQSGTLGHHLFNLLAHLVCAALLFAVIRRTIASQTFAPGAQTRATGLSAICALLWAIHPLQTEAVNYIVQRTELLVSLFLLATLYCSIRAWDATTARRRVGWWIAGVVACVLGMGSKEVMVVAPLLIVLYDRAFRVPSWRELIIPSRGERGRQVFYGALVLTLALLIILLLNNPRASTVGFNRVAWYEYLLAQGWAIPHYARLALVPVGFTVDYGEVLVGGPIAAIGLAMLALLFGMVIAAWRRVGRWGWAAFLGAWFFLILAPSSSVVPIATEIAAERRFYLPLAALIVAIVIAVDALARNAVSWAPRAASRLASHGALLAAFVFVALGATTFERSRKYADREALYREAISHVPRNARAYGNLGGIIEKDPKRLDEAAELYRESLRINPSYAFGQQRLAVVYVLQGRFADAKPLLENLLSRNPGEPWILGRLGLTIGALGNPDSAVRLLERSVSARMDPQSLSDLGLMYGAVGRLSDAAAALDRALRIDPYRAATRSSLGFVLIGLGRSREAIPHLQDALVLDPESAITRARIALALADIGDRAGAARAAADAAQLAGDEARVYALAGKAFRAAGFPTEAASVFERAVQLDPTDDESRRALSALRAKR